MVIAEVVCSDEDCDAWFELAAEAWELELLVCDGCGCTLQVVNLSDAILVSPQLLPAPVLRLAA